MGGTCGILASFDFELIELVTLAVSMFGQLVYRFAIVALFLFCFILLQTKLKCRIL